MMTKTELNPMEKAHAQIDKMKSINEKAVKLEQERVGKKSKKK